MKKWVMLAGVVKVLTEAERTGAEPLRSCEEIAEEAGWGPKRVPWVRRALGKLETARFAERPEYDYRPSETLYRIGDTSCRSSELLDLVVFGEGMGAPSIVRRIVKVLQVAGSPEAGWVPIQCLATTLGIERKRRRTRSVSRFLRTLAHLVELGVVACRPGADTTPWHGIVNQYRLQMPWRGDTEAPVFLLARAILERYERVELTNPDFPDHRVEWRDGEAVAATGVFKIGTYGGSAELRIAVTRPAVLLEGELANALCHCGRRDTPR